jgi:predicted ester cyclase
MTDVRASTPPIPSQAGPAGAEALGRAYLDAWNRHDGAGVAALVTGSYTDPTLPERLRGPALAAVVDGLCAAFPDLAFEAEGPPLVDGDRMLLQWRMRGANTGAPLPGAPAPTGGAIDLPGVDVVTVAEGRIVDVVGYFDQKTLVEQLGLQIFVMPVDGWPVSYGTSMRLDLDHRAAPGALTLTWIDLEGAQEQGQLIARSTDIVMSLAGEPGFLGFSSTTIGARNATLTLWTSPEAAESALARSRPHEEAAEQVRAGGFAARGFTSFWAPHRLNAQFARCECGALVELGPEDATACACGELLTPTPYI